MNSLYCPLGRDTEKAQSWNFELFWPATKSPLK